MNTKVLNINFTNNSLDFLDDEDSLRLPILFNIGNLKDIKSLKTLKKTYKYTSDKRVKNYYKKIMTVFENLEELLKLYDKFIIWYSDFSNEFFGMIYIVNLLSRLNLNNIYLISCTGKIYTNNLVIELESASEVTEKIFYIKRKQLRKLDLDERDILKGIFSKYFFSDCEDEKYIKLFDNGKVTLKNIYEISDFLYKNIFNGMSIYKAIKIVTSNFELDNLSAEYIIILLHENGKIYSDKGKIYKI